MGLKACFLVKMSQNTLISGPFQLIQCVQLNSDPKNEIWGNAPVTLNYFILIEIIKIRLKWGLFSENESKYINFRFILVYLSVQLNSDPKNEIWGNATVTLNYLILIEIVKIRLKWVKNILKNIFFIKMGPFQSNSDPQNEI